MTLAQLVNAVPALGELQQLKTSAKLAYQIAKLSEAVGKEAQYYHNQRNALLVKFGTPRDEQDGAYTITGENKVQFAAALDDLNAIEVTIDKWVLSLDQLEGIELTGQTMLGLMPLMQEPTP